MGFVEPQVYAEDVRHSVMFLEGRSNALTDELSAAMEDAAVNLEFERAAELRDQIGLLRRVQDQQSMEGGSGDVDVIAAFINPGGACVHLISVRGGRVLGSKNFFPQVGIEEDVAEVMAAFLGQYYISSPERDLPAELIVNVVHEDFPALIEAIDKLRGRELTISHRVRGTRARWQQLAVTNAEQALGARLANRQHVAARFDALADVLNLDEPPQRLECYDISHSSGEATVASCVVFGPEGPIKSDYRRYNIEGVTPGDDYAAMHQALMRRFGKLKDGEGKLPDILLVDGGKGQLSMARDVLNELMVPDLILLGVAKGATRKAGFETLYLNDAAHEFTLKGDSPALHLIQQIRDEAHRFAITGHRARRGKTRRTSTLEGVAGVGPTRRRDLLKHFGGLQELSRASIEEIAKAPGISKKSSLSRFMQTCTASRMPVNLAASCADEYPKSDYRPTRPAHSDLHFAVLFAVPLELHGLRLGLCLRRRDGLAGWLPGSTPGAEHAVRRVPRPGGRQADGRGGLGAAGTGTRQPLAHLAGGGDHRPRNRRLGAA
nr:hypothetical protein GCM10020185_01470 [Pseudomonas brassicacearum subsp. brassicacearum]